MNKKPYTTDQLLKVIESYYKMIENSGKRYPIATLDDIKHSARAVLKANGQSVES